MLLQSKFDAAEQIRQSASQQIEQIRSRRQLTDDAKLVRIAKVHQAASARMRELEQESTQASKSARSEAEQRAFGIGNLKGDTASLAISYRDALDRASQASTPKDAMALMVRANRSGDEALARATASHAFDMATSGLGRMDPGWGEVVGQFAEQRPDVTADIETLRQLAKPVSNATELFAFVLPAPPELSSVSSARLNTLINSDDAA